jgi:hypothetical protein
VLVVVGVQPSHPPFPLVHASHVVVFV